MFDAETEAALQRLDATTDEDIRAMLQRIYPQLSEEGRRAVDTGLAAHASGASSVAAYRKMVKG